MLAHRQLRLSSAIGLAISVCALHIVYSGRAVGNGKDPGSPVLASPSPAAWCDLAEHISCGKVLRSRYSRGFGVIWSVFGSDASWMPSNSLLGVVYYATVIALTYLHHPRGHPRHSPGWRTTLVALVAAANLMTLYLAYLLLFVLHTVCLLCLATYAVNYANLHFALRLH